MASKKTLKDELRISRKKGNTAITGVLLGFEFEDKETGMIVSYIPAVDISGYGKTAEEANEMVRHSLDSYMLNLVNLPIKDIHQELFSLGWSQQKINTKIFKPNFNSESKMSEQGVENFKPVEHHFAA